MQQDFIWDRERISGLFVTKANAKAPLIVKEALDTLRKISGVSFKLVRIPNVPTK